MRLISQRYSRLSFILAFAQAIYVTLYASLLVEYEALKFIIQSSPVRNPVVQVVLAVVVVLVIAGMTMAVAISGALTGAAITIIGLLGLIGLVWAIKKVGNA